MDQRIIEELRKITDEEKQILMGRIGVDQSIYQEDDKITRDRNIFDAKKLLDAGKLISIRKHTRFVHFPKHSHNYVEVMYMCTGSTRHVINGDDMVLRAGELLFLNQNATQEIYPAGEEDIGINFIILPGFFDYALRMMDGEDNTLRRFVIDCLKGEDNQASYMHFKVADILPVQNLVENLIWTLMNHQQNKRNMNQVTMGLLLLQILNHLDTVETDMQNDGQKLVMSVLNFIEERYKDGELSDLAKELHYDLYWLSKEIKKKTGQNFTDLLQAKRLSQAAYLLTHTAMTISDIAIAVGYENVSYFHRIFYKKYEMTPRQYRMSSK